MKASQLRNIAHEIKRSPVPGNGRSLIYYAFYVHCDRQRSVPHIVHKLHEHHGHLGAGSGGLGSQAVPPIPVIMPLSAEPMQSPPGSEEPPQEGVLGNAHTLWRGASCLFFSPELTAHRSRCSTAPLRGGGADRRYPSPLPQESGPSDWPGTRPAHQYSPRTPWSGRRRSAHPGRPGRT